MSKDREQLVQEFFANFAVLKRQATLNFGQAAGKAGLSLSQSELLYIVKNNQPLNFKELANIMQLTPGAVTQLVENLVQAGYLQRINDDSDRRVQLLSLSKNGVDKVLELKKYHHQRAVEMATILSDKELLAMHEIQEKMIAHFSHNVPGNKDKSDKESVAIKSMRG